MDLTIAYVWLNGKLITSNPTTLFVGDFGGDLPTMQSVLQSSTLAEIAEVYRIRLMTTIKMTSRNRFG